MVDDSIEEEVGAFLSRYLSEFHQVTELHWGRFLSPFLCPFFEYLGSSSESRDDEASGSPALEIPYANGDFILSLEAQGVHYRSLRRGRFSHDATASVPIGAGSRQYVDHYVFPVSSALKIAFLSFPGRAERLLFYLTSFARVRPCRLDWVQVGPEEFATGARGDLLRALQKRFTQLDTSLLGLLAYSLPSTYLENFDFCLAKARCEMARLRDVRVVFFIRHFVFNPTLLLLLCLKDMDQKCLVTFQHGASYGQTKPGWSERVEKKFATRFLTWGYKYDSCDWPFVSLRFRRQVFRLPFSRNRKNALLVVLPLVFRDSQFDRLRHSFELLALQVAKDSVVCFRFDPRERNQKAILSLADSLGLGYRVDSDRRSLPEVAKGYREVGFVTPNATGFLELLVSGLMPYLFFTAEDFSIRKESLPVYEDLKNAGVWFDFDSTGVSSRSRFRRWLALRAFRRRFVQTSFFPEARLLWVLLRMARGEELLKNE